MLTDDLPAVTVVRTPEAAVALLDPERRRLTEVLAERPESATGLARRLGETRQRINYHLRVLEEAGLIELAEERQRRGRIERIMRTAARRFVIDPAMMGSLAAADPDETGDRFSATYLVALAARAVRELASLMARASAKHSRLATASINAHVRLASPAHYSSFVADLTAAVSEVIERHNEPRGDGHWFRVIGATYPGPAPSRNQQEASDA
jgi:DNA-binding transcriptional ArsR family regulator